MEPASPIQSFTECLKPTFGFDVSANGKPVYPGYSWEKISLSFRGLKSLPDWPGCFERILPSVLGLLSVSQGSEAMLQGLKLSFKELSLLCRD